ncbi:YlbG family protein [Alteribacillus sp. HJP-4]|uniref:YlbG family protein n=1 Tax=Alteribacillus sp. HJP-4 TaxID=2775394 RepID=UPI0035CD0A83
MYPERIGMAVWLRSTKQVRHLRKHGVVHYVSKNMKYAILYCNSEDAEHTQKKLEGLSFVEKVEQSMKPYVSTEFSGPVYPREKEKSFDYNMGL